jgi:hypothetical protein
MCAILHSTAKACARIYSLLYEQGALILPERIVDPIKRNNYEND